MDNRRLFLAALLSLGVLLLWQWIFPPEPPVQAPAPVVEQAEPETAESRRSEVARDVGRRVLGCG